MLPDFQNSIAFWEVKHRPNDLKTKTNLHYI